MLGNRRSYRESFISQGRIVYVYRPRNSQTTLYYQCVEDHFETLEQAYDERFSKQYGFFRPYVKHVIYRFTDMSGCGWEALKVFFKEVTPKMMPYRERLMRYTYSGDKQAIKPGKIHQPGMLLPGKDGLHSP
ncbi:MAG: hypothetical protein GY850_15705 [bacterium]|nr:hypothetical protein [bacterium]